MIPNKISISLWSPLLQHIQVSHPDFPLVFCRCFISLLTGTKSVERDLSYDAYIACWVMWAVETWQVVSSEYFNLRSEVLSHLLRELGCYPLIRAPTYGYWLLYKGLLLMFLSQSHCPPRSPIPWSIRIWRGDVTIASIAFPDLSNGNYISWDQVKI